MRKKAPPFIVHDGKVTFNRNALKKTFPHLTYHVTLLENYIMIEMVDRYTPTDLRICCRNPLPLGEDLQPQNPIDFYCSNDVGEMFDLDFGNNCVPCIMLGNMDEYVMPGCTTFTPATVKEDTDTATHVLMKISWNKSCPNPCSNLQYLAGVAYSNTTTGNTGMRGVDWWIFPLSAVKCSVAKLHDFRYEYARKLYDRAEAAARLQRLADSAYANGF